jgi:hypothetical protein
MSATIGPTTWWIKSKEAADYYARICPVGTILPDGSAVYCKQGGQAWIVAPNCTQISDQWASGCWNNCLLVGATNSLCCICSWPSVCSRLSSCGFNPCDWFIPDQTVLFNSHFCRSFWDICSSTTYWSSSENTAFIACVAILANGCQCSSLKSETRCVRSVRCVCL